MEHGSFHQPHQTGNTPQRSARLIPELLDVNADSGTPNEHVTKGLALSRRSLALFVSASLGAAGFGVYAISQNWIGGRTVPGPAETIYISDTPSISPSVIASSNIPTSSPSNTVKVAPVHSAVVSTSPTETLDTSPSASPSTRRSSPSANISPSATTSSEPSRDTCSAAPGTYKVCEIGAWAYSYPSTTSGHKVHQFNAPTQISPECKNNSGWVLADFENPGGAQAGYIKESAIKGNIGSVALCN